MKSHGKIVVAIAVAAFGLAILACQPDSADEPEFRLRSDVEAARPAAEEAFRADPDDEAARFAYADILYKLGDVWEADEVAAPLGREASSNVSHLRLAAETAYLLGDYDRAETLFERAVALAEPDSDDHAAVVRRLALAYYQSNQFAKASQLPVGDDDAGRSLVHFMQAFDGEPYGIEWTTDEMIAHMAMTNDITQPGALPIVELDVNGETLTLILDTGGDRLFLDTEVYTRLDLPVLATREARYAYTGGETVEEPLGVAETVTMGDVVLRNVPVVGATWRAMGQTTDGVLPTHILKQFLSTVDYDNRRITLRPRDPDAVAQVKQELGDDLVEVPFYMAATHLMFAKGVLNGAEGINYFMDSGLAMSMPMILVDETVELLELDTNAIEGTDYYWTSIESHGLNGLVKGATQAMGNVFVEDNPFWQTGFMMDALMSHQYLWPLGSWTIDFDNMTYYFPAQSSGEQATDQ